jgi:hypothetical protein
MSGITPKADILHALAISALGQKQTYALQKAMSALPPKAGTKADIRQTVLRPFTVSLPDLGVIAITQP